MRIIAAAGLVLVLGILGYLIYTSFQPVHEPVHLLPLIKEEESPVPDQPALRLERAEIALVDKDNRLCWQLLLDAMEKEETAFLLKGVEGVYFAPAGAVFNVRAEKGSVNEDFSRLCLQRVIVLSTDELAMEVEELIWEAASEGLLYGDKMTLEYRGIKIFAGRFRSDLNLERIIVDGPSRWEFQPGKRWH